MQDWEFKELSLCDREDLGERCISVCRYPLGFAGMGFFCGQTAFMSKNVAICPMI